MVRVDQGQHRVPEASLPAWTMGDRTPGANAALVAERENLRSHQMCWCTTETQEASSTAAAPGSRGSSRERRVLAAVLFPAWENAGRPEFLGSGGFVSGTVLVYIKGSPQETGHRTQPVSAAAQRRPAPGPPPPPPVGTPVRCPLTLPGPPAGWHTGWRFSPFTPASPPPP